MSIPTSRKFIGACGLAQCQDHLPLYDMQGFVIEGTADRAGANDWLGVAPKWVVIAVAVGKIEFAAGETPSSGTAIETYQSFLAESVWDTEQLAQDWCKHLVTTGIIKEDENVRFLLSVQPVNVGSPAWLR